MRIAIIALLGLVFAAGLGTAAHVIARDTVALPVASLDARENLAPGATTRRTRTAGQTTTRKKTRTATGPVTTRRTTTDEGDDHGRNRGRGGGDDSSGKGSGGGGDD
jgi:uncharacterized membrane protein YgcG